jgi:REP element-mobilizing transposase RayT
VRQPRNLLPPAGIYHVTTRGVARAAIFLDEDERRLFLRLFAAEVHRHDWRCHAFCLMTTHYHLVVETELWRLSDGMHRLNGTYALTFNRRQRPPLRRALRRVATERRAPPPPDLRVRPPEPGPSGALRPSGRLALGSRESGLKRTLVRVHLPG